MFFFFFFFRELTSEGPQLIRHEIIEKKSLTKKNLNYRWMEENLVVDSPQVGEASLYVLKIVENYT